MQCNISGQPNPKHPTYWDLWSQSTEKFPGGPLFGYNGSLGDENTYSGFVFTEQAVKTIYAHNKTTPNQPMFMYLALHNTHAPIEAPDRFVSMYNFKDKKRNTFLAMVSVVDESVANVTRALKETGMWSNTLLVSVC